MKTIVGALVVLVVTLVANSYEPLVGFTIGTAGGLILGAAPTLRGARIIKERYMRVPTKIGHDAYVGSAAVREGSFIVLVGLTLFAAGAFFLWAYLTTR